MSYKAPLREMQFVVHELAGLRTVQALPGFEDASDEIVGAVLEECSKLMSEVIAPLNRVGDTQPARWADGAVTTSPGFQRAFRAFVDGGWQGVMHPSRHGGQGLPKLVATPCLEMLQAANLSFALCPLLTDGAIEAFLIAGSEEQQQRYVPKLIDGSWTGTMILPSRRPARTFPWCARARSASPMGATASSGKKSSSRTASTTWRRTSCTSCWRAPRCAPWSQGALAVRRAQVRPRC